MSDVLKATYRHDHALTEQEATIFWGLLDSARARPSMRDEFIRYMTRPSRCPKEFRFQGQLGWGGKAHFDGRRAYVSCYSEDDTPERDEIKRVINAELKGLLR